MAKTKVKKKPDYGKRWRKKHPGYHSRKSKKWREENPELIVTGNKEWREQHPDYAAKYYQKHSKEIKARRRQRDKERGVKK